MVSFLQKNAAKIVIISGAALISTISGGCGTECTQDSTLSAKCDKGTTEQQKKCTATDGKVVSTIVLCKGKTCEDSEFASSGRCCTDKTPEAGTIATCATNGKKDTAKCSLAACDTAKPYRVKIKEGTSGCLAECTASDTVRQTNECACLAKTDGKVTAVALCAEQHLCKSTGVVELPPCSFADGKFNSNCTYGGKTCNDYSDGDHCTGTIIEANEIAVTKHALCTGLTLQPSKKNAPIPKDAGAKMKICAENEVCQIDSGSTDAATCVSLTAATIKPCGANTSASTDDVLNCKYAVAGGSTKNQYCGKRNKTEYAWVASTKECRANCSSTNGKAACACVHSNTATATAVIACEATKPFCKTDACSATKP